VTRLRKMMLEELQGRNYSAITRRNYLRVVADFAKYFDKSPDKLGPSGVPWFLRVCLRLRWHLLICLASSAILRASFADCFRSLAITSRRILAF